MKINSSYVNDLQIKSSAMATCDVYSQIHTDWVNDIVVCEQGSSVITASSDRTVKLWRPYSHDSHQAHTIGWHTDYVKCLSYASEAGWVASGGLDKRINIWDIEKGEAALTIQVGSMNINNDQPNDTTNTSHITSTKSSIYAMAVNPSGTMLVTGSPERVVRVWDPRSGKRVSKLTGHTDNIRALLISHDGQYVLSGSSDSTIKLWSVKAQRCLTTYETHTDSIWSLYSDHPDLKTFYAGSRDGLVTKTEIPREGASDLHEESECIGLFKENSGVGKIVAFDDKYIWTATSSSSINRWLSIPSRETRQKLPRSIYNVDIPSTAIVDLPPTQTPYSAQAQEHYIANDSLTLYAGSVMSIPMSYNDDDDESVESLTPLRETPDQIIEGNHGITAHLSLQNRLHILTKDTTGEVALWDIVRCTEIKKFGKRDLEEVAKEISGIECFPSWCSVTTKIGAITVQLNESNCFDCEMYADEIGVGDDYQYREDQRVNLGKWLLINLFSPFISNEVKQQGIEYGNDLQKTNDDNHSSRMNRNSSTILSKLDKTESSTATTPTIQTDRSTPMPPPSALKLPLTAITTNPDHSPFHSNTTDNESTSSSSDGYQSRPMTAPPTTGRTFDYFSGAHHPPPPSQNQPALQTPPPAVLSSSPTASNSNFMNRLKSLSVKAKIGKNAINDDKSEGSSSTTEEQNSSTVNGDNNSHTSQNGKDESSVNNTDEQQQQENEDENEHYTPPHRNDFPPLSIPSTTSIYIAEESAEASTGMDLYRGDFGCVGDDCPLIHKAAPSWLLSFLLYNKIPNKEIVKLTFVLKPYEKTKLPELPGGPNNRLLANRVLRIRKLLQYVVEKIEINPPPKLEDIELLCGDTKLNPTMTLASVKQSILKTSGDVILSYKYKNEGSSSL
ncbi:unnamed protein product [Cunninghamella blakesleeana]